MAEFGQTPGITFAVVDLADNMQGEFLRMRSLSLN